MSVAIGTFTYNGVIGSIRMKLKQFTDEKYPKPTIRDDIYRAICELAELSGTKNEPIFRGSAVVPQTKSVVSNDSAGVTFIQSTKVLLVPLASTNPDNVWTGDADGFDPTWEGAAVALTYQGYGIHQTTIATYIDTTHVVLTDELPDDWGLSGTTLPDGTSIVMSTTAGASIVDISNIPDYKGIDRITVIEDSVNGECVEMDEKSFRAIKHYVSAENDYRDTVIWYRSGTLLYFSKGDLTSYGTRTMYYTRNPIKPTAYTEYVDYPDTQMKMVIDVVVTGILQSLNIQLPQDLQSIVAKLNTMRGAVAEERQKAQQNFTTQG